MSRVGYKQLFQVKALHSYFNNNVCSCLDFRPSDSTLEMMKRFGLVVKDQIDGFGFYCSTNDSLNNYLNYIATVSNETAFDFNIHSKDSNFNLKTDFPTSWIGTINYNSGNKKNTLSQGVLELKVDILANDNTEFLAQLTVNFKDIIKYKELNSTVEFEIKFKSRSTQWQYYVINKSSVKLDNPKISSKPEMNFEGPVKIKIATGEEALLFTSGDHLIPLTQSPKYKFNLIDESVKEGDSQKNRISSKMILNGLPNPKPERIGFEIDAITKIVSSPMYVYI